MNIIFVLKLQSGKYYLYKAKQIKNKDNYHLKLQNILWIRKYNPVKVIKIIKNSLNEDLDKYTIKYMKKFGIMNVRGGSFSAITLQNDEKEFLYKMIKETNNKCNYCGNIGHSTHHCYYEIDTETDDDNEENEILFRCGNCQELFKTENKLIKHREFYCSHSINNLNNLINYLNSGN